jgi:glycosyltransferase involved in cell wall biosynthesis
VSDASASGRPLVSVVVPMYNEEAVAERCLHTLVEYVATLADRFDFEILVVDDGSTDATRSVALSFAADHPQVRVLVHRANFRLGPALRFAFGQSRGEYIIVFDADLSYDVEHIGRLLDCITETRARIVIASPYMPGGETRGIPFRRRVLSQGANWFLARTAQGTMEGKLHTVTGMVRAYDGPFIRTLDLKAADVDVNTEIVYKAQVLRARIEEIPAVLDWTGLEDRRPVTGFNTRLYWTTAKQMVSAFLFRPFIFFLVPGLLLLLLSAVLAVFGVASIASHDSVSDAFADHPALYLSGSVALLIGVQFVSLAILTLQAKRYFEELFHLGTITRRLMSDEPELRPDRH